MNLGIICEFNPFHKGHKYLIDCVKHNDDCVICAMSGNFVQRGEPAVYDKFQRAETAIKNGADLVIEIPTVYSTLSAQGFAKAGTVLLEATGICDGLAFGAECDDAEELLKLADRIKEKDALIKKELVKGLSYPAARQKAVSSPLLELPNNILALEYLSITKLKPIAVKRIGAGHDSNDTEYSASEIRRNIPLKDKASLLNCEKAVLYKLRTMKAEDFAEIDDVSEGLENRIEDAVKKAESLEELYSLIKTKRYTHSRIRRIILRAFLGINKTDNAPQYIRVLAFNAKGKALLSEMKEKATLPIIIKYADAKAVGGEVLKGIEREFSFTDIYGLCFDRPRRCALEQTKRINITEV